MARLNVGRTGVSGVVTGSIEVGTSVCDPCMSSSEAGIHSAPEGVEEECVWWCLGLDDDSEEQSCGTAAGITENHHVNHKYPLRKDRRPPQR